MVLLILAPQRDRLPDVWGVRVTTRPQHPTSRSSVTISEGCLKCDSRCSRGTQLGPRWKERNPNNKEMSSKNRQVVPGSPRPFQHPLSCLFIFFFKQLDRIIIHQQVELLEGMVQSLSLLNSAGTQMSPEGFQVLPPPC